MKVSDYIVDFLIEKGITDVFGYPGGMLTHFMDSLYKQRHLIKSHTNYHEQSSSFAACGYAQVKHIPGVAFATSGPGATNLITGICNAYFDSIPTIFITGQVNTYESKKGYKVRQKGFQETDIISLVKDITKYAVYIDDSSNIRFELEKAYDICMSGRPGPVVLDIPMNIFRADVDIDLLSKYTSSNVKKNYNMNDLLDNIKISKRPCIIAGAGIKGSNRISDFRDFAKKLGLPVVSSMISFDNLEYDDELNFGFLGAYGHRYANFLVAKSDLIIVIGSRLDIRQIGSKTANFAPMAKLIRIDIDEDELELKIKNDELHFNLDLGYFLDKMNSMDFKLPDFSDWLNVCNKLKESLKNYDIEPANSYISKISDVLPDNCVITTDVGQNQVWVAQSLKNKPSQLIIFSGGHAAMGYSVPAAIGAFFASNSPVIAFIGDGGLQMCIHELQFISKYSLPIKIVLLNNKSLGMITHFQEMYFDSNYSMTTENDGYYTPDFGKISMAYNIKYTKVEDLSNVDLAFNDFSLPELIEISLPNLTHVYPKLEYGKPNQDQEPAIDRNLYDYLMSL